ncbi:MAG: hypothetical protein AAFO06_02045 [Cyanobacteria bacterium J06597_16]
MFKTLLQNRWSHCGALMTVAILSLLTAPTLFQPAQAAEPCSYQCGSNQIRFVPGQPITIEFINRTNGLINLERVLDIDMQWLRPQTNFAIQTLVGADAEMSLVFWDDNNRAVNAVLHRPDSETLQVELLPSGHDGDYAVHVVNDGRVLVY